MCRPLQQPRAALVKAACVRTLNQAALGRARFTKLAAGAQALPRLQAVYGAQGEENRFIQLLQNLLAALMEAVVHAGVINAAGGRERCAADIVLADRGGYCVQRPRERSGVQAELEQPLRCQRRSSSSPETKPQSFSRSGSCATQAR